MYATTVAAIFAALATGIHAGVIKRDDVAGEFMVYRDEYCREEASGITARTGDTTPILISPTPLSINSHLPNNCERKFLSL